MERGSAKQNVRVALKVTLLLHHDRFRDLRVALGGCEVEVVDAGHINFTAEDETHHVDVAIRCGSV